MELSGKLTLNPDFNAINKELDKIVSQIKSKFKNVGKELNLLGGLKGTTQPKSQTSTKQTSMNEGFNKLGKQFDSMNAKLVKLQGVTKKAEKSIYGSGLVSALEKLKGETNKNEKGILGYSNELKKGRKSEEESAGKLKKALNYLISPFKDTEAQTKSLANPFLTVQRILKSVAIDIENFSKSTVEKFKYITSYQGFKDLTKKVGGMAKGGLQKLADGSLNPMDMMNSIAGKLFATVKEVSSNFDALSRANFGSRRLSGAKDYNLEQGAGNYIPIAGSVGNNALTIQQSEQLLQQISDTQIAFGGMTKTAFDTADALTHFGISSLHSMTEFMDETGRSVKQFEDLRGEWGMMIQTSRQLNIGTNKYIDMVTGASNELMEFGWDMGHINNALKTTIDSYKKGDKTFKGLNLTMSKAIAVMKGFMGVHGTINEGFAAALGQENGGAEEKVNPLKGMLRYQGYNVDQTDNVGKSKSGHDVVAFEKLDFTKAPAQIIKTLEDGMDYIAKETSGKMTKEERGYAQLKLVTEQMFGGNKEQGEAFMNVMAKNPDFLKALKSGDPLAVQEMQGIEKLAVSQRQSLINIDEHLKIIEQIMTGAQIKILQLIVGILFIISQTLITLVKFVWKGLTNIITSAWKAFLWLGKTIGNFFDSLSATIQQAIGQLLVDIGFSSAGGKMVAKADEKLEIIEKNKIKEREAGFKEFAEEQKEILNISNSFEQGIADIEGTVTAWVRDLGELTRQLAAAAEQAQKMSEKAAKPGELGVVGVSSVSASNAVVAAQAATQTFALQGPGGNAGAAFVKALSDVFQSSFLKDIADKMAESNKKNADLLEYIRNLPTFSPTTAIPIISAAYKDIALKAAETFGVAKDALLTASNHLDEAANAMEKAIAQSLINTIEKNREKVLQNLLEREIELTEEFKKSKKALEDLNQNVQDYVRAFPLAQQILQERIADSQTQNLAVSNAIAAMLEILGQRANTQSSQNIADVTQQANTNLRNNDTFNPTLTPSQTQTPNFSDTIARMNRGESGRVMSNFPTTPSSVTPPATVGGAPADYRTSTITGGMSDFQPLTPRTQTSSSNGITITNNVSVGDNSQLKAYVEQKLSDVMSIFRDDVNRFMMELFS